MTLNKRLPLSGTPGARGDGMRYRIYALGAGGNIESGADLSAGNDRQALHEAGEHANLHGLEIWQGNRQVALISPPSVQFRFSERVPARTAYPSAYLIQGSI
jgi:hypothetical protein